MAHCLLCVQLAGTGTGFKFYDIDPQALYNTMGWAVSTYFDRPKHIDNMITQAMKKDYSWSIPADLYIGIYKELSGK